MKYYFECPSCGSADEFLLPKEESSGLGLLLFLFGGFIPVLPYSDVRRHRVQCSKCYYIFRQPPLPRTTLSRLAAWIIGIIILFGFSAFLMIAFPEIVSLLPQSPVLTEIEQLISNNPRAIIFGFFPMIAVILMLSLVGSWASNRSAHRELRKEFATKPKRNTELKEKTPTCG